MISSEKQIERYKAVAETIKSALEEDPTVNTAVLGYYASIAWGKKYDLAKDKPKCFAFFQYIRKKGIVETKKCADGSLFITVNPKWLKSGTDIQREERLEEEIARADSQPLNSPADFVAMVKVYTNDNNILAIVEKKATELFVRKEDLESKDKVIQSYNRKFGFKIDSATIEKDGQHFELKDVNLNQLANLLDAIKKGEE